MRKEGGEWEEYIVTRMEGEKGKGEEYIVMRKDCDEKGREYIVT